MPSSQKKFYNQAGRWWGTTGITNDHRNRVEKVRDLLGSDPIDILDLGSGGGGFAAAMAELGHSVVGIENADKRAKQADELAKTVTKGSLSIICDDFYAHNFYKQFDLVTYWDGFGIGPDEDQVTILKRISQEWLKSDGFVLIDVYSPYGPSSKSGTQEQLSKLPNVSESVDMVRKVHFDYMRSRWIDEWQPKHNPEVSMSQDLRCYTPEDFKMLVAGTGLKIVQIRVGGKVVPANLSPSESKKLFKHCWSYFVQLARSSAKKQEK